MKLRQILTDRTMSPRICDEPAIVLAELLALVCVSQNKERLKMSDMELLIDSLRMESRL